jgi:hypothetical protein
MLDLRGGCHCGEDPLKGSLLGAFGNTPEVKYRFYCATCKPVAHNLDYVDDGTVIEVTLADDISSFPVVAGKIVLGVSAAGPIGNESEITTITADIDFTTPGTPRISELKMRSSAWRCLLESEFMIR